MWSQQYFEQECKALRRATHTLSWKIELLPQSQNVCFSNARVSRKHETKFIKSKWGFSSNKCADVPFSCDNCTKINTFLPFLCNQLRRTRVSSLLLYLKSKLNMKLVVDCIFRVYFRGCNYGRILYISRQGKQNNILCTDNMPSENSRVRSEYCAFQ